METFHKGGNFENTDWLADSLAVKNKTNHGWHWSQGQT